MKYAFIALPFVLLASCSNVEAAPESAGGVAIGETAYVDGPRVTPLAVIEDSRCPSDVTCIWGGRVVVRVRVEGGAWRREIELATGTPQPVADGRLSLVSVTPPRGNHDTGRPAPETYRFTFAFKGGL